MPQRILIGLVGAAVASCAAPSLAPPPASPSRLLGEPAPSFHGRTVTGQTFQSGEAAGRVLVVEFFAAYCPPCQRSLPALQKLRRSRPDLAIVGVSLDGDAEAARRQIAHHRLTFPVIHDPAHAIAGRFRVTELPASFVVGPDGRVAWSGGPGQTDDAVPRAAAAIAKERQGS